MKIIKSINNPFISELILLKDKTIRFEKRSFLIEGFHLVEEALKLNLLDVVLSSDEKYLNSINLDEKYLVTDAIIKKISTTKTPQNIIGVVKMKEDINIDNLLSKKDLKLVLLDDVSDPGNMGTIIRTSCALGYDAVISSLKSVDYYNEKVVRSTQGALFRIPLIKMDLIELIDKLKTNNVAVIGTSLESSKSIKTVEAKPRFAVVFGNEAHGVSKEVLSRTDYNVIIPMESDVESLNVSVASAITMWELKK